MASVPLLDKGFYRKDNRNIGRNSGARQQRRRQNIMKGQISEKMAEVDRVSQVTNNRFLNYYELNTTDRIGNHKKYYMCSRRESAEKLDLMTGADRPDGVVMFALYGEGRDRVVLVHQYRYPLGA